MLVKDVTEETWENFNFSLKKNLLIGVSFNKYVNKCLYWCVLCNLSVLLLEKKNQTNNAKALCVLLGPYVSWILKELFECATFFYRHLRSKQQQRRVINT